MPAVFLLSSVRETRRKTVGCLSRAPVQQQPRCRTRDTRAARPCKHKTAQGKLRGFEKILKEDVFDLRAEHKAVVALYIYVLLVGSVVIISAILRMATSMLALARATPTCTLVISAVVVSRSTCAICAADW